MTSPISSISSLFVGTVESVAPDEIKVLLDIESPRNTALNTGIPIPFPKINSFVLLPNESGAVVGIIVWLGLEKSTYPKQLESKEFGLIDLPFPLRKMTVCPYGTLLSKNNRWQLEQGVHSFPSVGDSVILPTRDQVIAIVTDQGNEGRVSLGTCPIALDAPISVDPDKLFGRHLAVLGSTGSGKSCTLAALVRSSVESAQDSIEKTAYPNRNNKAQNNNSNPNARFIILDPNGEYSKCFGGLGAGCRVFRVSQFTDADTKDFTLPAWMWNSSEWAAVAQAAPRTQRPLLQEALRNLRSNRQITLTGEKRLMVRCKSLKSFLLQFAGTGASGFPKNKDCGQQLSRFIEDISHYCSTLTGEIKVRTEKAVTEISTVIDVRKWESGVKSGFDDFSDKDIEDVNKVIEHIIEGFPQDHNGESINEDTPLHFDPQVLAEHLESLAMQEGGSTSQFISTLTMRIKGLISDPRMNEIINPKSSVSLEDWLNLHVGEDGSKNGPVAVIDLSFVPYEILHLVIAVSTRLILESLQRYRKLNGNNLPTVLILEEAHTFVAKRRSHSDEIPNPADMCRGTFERVAREGRKFGLGLVLSSQRPSELSETVLSQCNSFLIHRITNDHDQELISRQVPDNSRGLLRELPSLPTRHCILLGIASKIPALVEVKHLDDSQRPASDDPKFWDVWTHREPRPIDWGKISRNWTGEETDK